MQLFLVLLLCATSYAGIVDHTRCGGAGTLRQLRIEDCTGPICYMSAGRPYSCEWDMIPSSAAPALRLTVTGIYLGYPVDIINSLLPNSSVQPGQLYTIRFTITPNDMICGNTMRVSGSLSNESSGLMEVCVSFQDHVMCPCMNC